MDGFETITRLGGYILLFSLILASISFYWPFHAQSCMLFTAPLELTTGLKQIAGAPLPWKSRYLASMLLTSFGGFCVMVQTKSVLENSLSLIPYAISKCLNASAIFLILVSPISSNRSSSSFVIEELSSSWKVLEIAAA